MNVAALPRVTLKSALTPSFSVAPHDFFAGVRPSSASLRHRLPALWFVPACTATTEASRKTIPLIFYVNKRVSGAEIASDINWITSEEAVEHDYVLEALHVR